MKARKWLIFMASVGLVFGLMTGCGGGGGGDGGSGTPDTGFTPDKIDAQVGQIADQLGCEYTEDTTAQNTKQSIALSLKTSKIIAKVIQNNIDTLVIAAITPQFIAATSSETRGDCGGSLTVNETGEYSVSYIFDNYCTSIEDTGVKVEIDGSLALEGNEEGDRIIASTPNPLTVSSHNPNTGENVSVTVDLDKAILSENEDGSMKIEITSLTVKDNTGGKTYGVRSFVANINMDTGSIDFNGTIDNPNLDIGSLKVNGTINGNTGEGHITATDENGVKVELTTTETEGILDVIYDGAPLGTMDCSMAELPI